MVLCYVLIQAVIVRTEPVTVHGLIFGPSHRAPAALARGTKTQVLFACTTHRCIGYAGDAYVNFAACMLGSNR